VKPTSTRLLPSAALLLSTSLAHADPSLMLVGAYDTGLGPLGAEIIDIRMPQGFATVTNTGGSSPGNSSIDVIKVSDVAAPTLVRRVLLQDTSRIVNSVAMHPSEDYFLVVQGGSSPAATGTPGSISAYRITNGAFLCSAEVGIQPDSVAISPDGATAIVANEAEGAEEGDNGGAGSVSRLSLTGFKPQTPDCSLFSATTIALPSATGTPGFSTGRTDDLARLSIDNSPGTLEPESVAFSPDSRYAFVTLQENNGVARVDLATNAVKYFGLGTVNHLADVAVSTPPNYDPVTPYTQFREPDGIKVTPDGRYFVTANEGDTANGAGGSGIRGGRTISVFDAATGALVGDTGRELDDLANDNGVYPDGRSNRGGSEPEVLDLVAFGGRTWVAVSLERAGGIALVDVTTPTAPIVVAFGYTGSTRANPEGVRFFARGNALFVASANEGNGTVSIFRVIP
jgi:hypothetical protein